MITLRFARGTLELHGLAQGSDDVPPEARWDGRTGCYRCEALEGWLSAGDYAADEAFRLRLQGWLSARWAEKDELLARLEAEHA